MNTLVKIGTSSGLLHIPHELLMLVVNLLNLGSTYSLSRVCRSLLIGIYNEIKDCSSMYIILDDTVCNSDVNLFKWLVADTNLLWSKQAYNYWNQVASSGCLEFFKYIHKNGFCLDYYACR